MKKLTRFTVAALGAMTLAFCETAIADDLSPPPGVGSTQFTYALKPGWNLIGYSSAATQDLNVRALLSGLSGSGVESTKYMIISAWKYLSPLDNGGVESWYFFSPKYDATALPGIAGTNHWQPLVTVKPGEGFWVNVRDMRANPVSDPVVPYYVTQ